MFYIVTCCLIGHLFAKMVCCVGENAQAGVFVCIYCVCELVAVPLGVLSTLGLY